MYISIFKLLHPVRFEMGTCRKQTKQIITIENYFKMMSNHLRRFQNVDPKFNLAKGGYEIELINKQSNVRNNKLHKRLLYAT